MKISLKSPKFSEILLNILKKLSKKRVGTLIKGLITLNMYLTQSRALNYLRTTFYSTTAALTPNSKPEVAFSRHASSEFWVQVIADSRVLLDIAEAVSQRCSVKKAFLEISQNSKERNCARVSFLIKLQEVCFWKSCRLSLQLY